MNARWLILNKDGDATIVDSSVGPSLLVFTSKAAAQGFIDFYVAYEGWVPDEYRARAPEIEASGDAIGDGEFAALLRQAGDKATHFIIDPDPQSGANFPRSIREHLLLVEQGHANPEGFAREP